MAATDKKSKAKPAESRKKKTKNISIARFGLTYLVLMGSFFFLIGFTPLQKIVDLNGLYTAGVVFATSKVLALIGIPSSCHGSIIQLPSISLDVKFGCNGLEAVMIYSIAVIAFPSTWRSKLIGIVSGFIVIQILNILRIAGLGYSGVHFKRIFEYLHLYVAQGIMIAVALGMFFLYLNYAKTTKNIAS